MNNATSMERCKKCNESFPGKTLWFLKYMGFFCATCAITVIEYWLDQGALVIRKIKESS